MPTPKKGARLGGSPAHQKLILANLATSLFEHGRITTTEAQGARAASVRGAADHQGQEGRPAQPSPGAAVIRDKGVVHALFTEIGPRYAERPGGYTRITKIGPRKGDNAPMAVIELVTEEYTPQARLDAVHRGRLLRPRPSRRRRSRRPRPPMRAEAAEDRGPRDGVDGDSESDGRPSPTETDARRGRGHEAGE